MSRAQFTIYTDGGCQPNPGPGGWAAIILDSQQHPTELSGRDPDCTNNRMEITAAIEALNSLPDGSRIQLITDSTYLKNGITQWISGWRRRGWKTASKQPVKNQDLWKALDSAVSRHQIDWRWTKGHAGDRWNERADELATAARGLTPKPTPSQLPIEQTDAVHVFLGVAWSGKRKRGGWGAVLAYGENYRELSGRATGNSSNATHILSALEGIQALKTPLPVNIYTVSDYLVRGATDWLASWKRNRWQTASGKPVASRELWQDLDLRLAQLRRGGYRISWHGVDKDNSPQEIEEPAT